MADKVKIAGTQAGAAADCRPSSTARKRSGPPCPQEYAMWTLADQMARVANGEWSSENERTNAVPPFFLVDTAGSRDQLSSISRTVGRDPKGFKDAFKATLGL